MPHNESFKGEPDDVHALFVEMQKCGVKMDFFKASTFFMIDGIEVNFIKHHVLGNDASADGSSSVRAQRSPRQDLIDVLRYDRFRLKYGEDAGFYSLDKGAWKA